MVNKEKLIGQDTRKVPTGYIQYGKHCYPYRVAYQDTDAGKIMYHGNHARAAERARMEMMALLIGTDIESGNASKEDIKSKYEFVIRKMESEFLAPLFLYDEVVIETSMHKLGKTSVTLRQEFICDDKIVSTLLITMVYVDLENIKPRRIDPFWLEKFEYITKD